jgi:ABC-2 type transport system permease protein
MTAAIAAPATPSMQPLAGPVTQARVIRSEWTKLRSLRSTWWSIGAAVLVTVGLGVLVSAIAASAANPSALSADVAGRSEIGNLLSSLVIAVLAVLLISSEYGTGMIRSSMTAVPRRLPVLWGKLTVFVAALLPVSLVASVVAFVLGQLVWRAKGRNHVWFGDPEVTRIVLGSALSLVLLGICALAIGTLVRNTAGGISVVVGLFFVLPTLLQAMPTRIADLGRFLPSNAGGALWHEALSSDTLAPWNGFALLCGYAAVLVAVAAWRLRRGDV